MTVDESSFRRASSGERKHKGHVSQSSRFAIKSGKESGKEKKEKRERKEKRRGRRRKEEKKVEGEL